MCIVKRMAVLLLVLASGAAAAADRSEKIQGASPVSDLEGPYDTTKIIEAATSPKSRLVLLSAHRGLWRDIPENTIAAIDAAVLAGFESVEIDVRLSQQGTPWLLHDFELARLTNGQGYITGTRDQVLASLAYNNRDGSVSSTKLQTLDDALEYLGEHLRLKPDMESLSGFVLVIDLKSPGGGDPNYARASGYQALKAAWASVIRVSNKFPLLRLGQSDLTPSLGRAIIFKVKAKDLPTDPAVLEQDLQLQKYSEYMDAFHLVPVLHPDDSTTGDAIFQAYLDKQYVPTFEANMEYIEQPYAWAWTQYLNKSGRTVTAFPSWNDYPEGVAKSSGVCCVYMNTDPANLTSPLSYIGSWDYSLQTGATWLTADTAPFLHEYLSARGLRNMEEIQ